MDDVSPTDNAPKPDDMPEDFYVTCISVTSKRPRTVIQHILKRGYITTEELQDDYGYTHAPRAIRDVREAGIPLETYSVVSKKTGRSIGAYRFDKSLIVAGRIGGRKAFSKNFKAQLIARYGSRSMLTNETLEPRYLQIDHRVPYEVAGNDNAENVESHMLLDASAQRAKSWSCEHCENFITIKDPNICRECFWAFPESYKHVAMRSERRLDVVWTGDEVAKYDRLVAEAKQDNYTPQELIKQILDEHLSSSENI